MENLSKRKKKKIHEEKTGCRKVLRKMPVSKLLDVVVKEN